VIDAICQWCVASAVVMTVLAAVAVARLLAGEDQYARTLRTTPDGRPTSGRDTRPNVA